MGRFDCVKMYIWVTANETSAIALHFGSVFSRNVSPIVYAIPLNGLGVEAVFRLRI